MWARTLVICSFLKDTLTWSELQIDSFVLFCFSALKTLFCHFLAFLDSLEKSVINFIVKFFVWISWCLLCSVVLWASCIWASTFHQIYETPGCNFCNLCVPPLASLFAAFLFFSGLHLDNFYHYFRSITLFSCNIWSAAIARCHFFIRHFPFNL